MVRPWIKRLGLWGGPTLLLILVWQVWDRYEESHVTAEIARIRASEAHGTLPNPNLVEHDAGRYYLAAGVLIQLPTSYPGHQAPMPASIYQLLPKVRDAVSAGQPLHGDMREEIRAILARNEEAIHLVDQAAAIPTLAYPNDQTFNLNNIDRAYSLATLNLIASNNPDGAADALASRLRVVRALEQRPNALNVLLKATTLQSIVEDLGLVLRGAPISADRDGKLDAMFAEHDNDQELEQTVRGNTAGIIRYASQIENAGAGGFSPWRPLWRRQMAESLRLAEECLGMATMPWPDRLTKIRALRGGSELRVLYRQNVTLGLVVEDCRQAAQATARSAALIRTARIALSVDVYRREHGRLPEGLSDLAADSPAASYADPFTGLPLNYRRDQNGFAVYSLGENAKDDGGVVIPRPRIEGESARQPADVGIAVTFRPSR